MPRITPTSGAVTRQPAVTDASTAHAFNVVFSDTELEAACNALGTTINTLIARLEAAGVIEA